MKKILIIIFLLFAISRPVFAEDQQITIPPTPFATASAPTPVGYTLPYPGLLPGSPLYPLKVFRDKIVEFFITDPIKKADFYLLQADKHLYTGIMLSQQGKFNDAEVVVSKGENYLDMSFGKAQKAKQASEPTAELTNKLSLSIMKHEEVIKALIAKAPKNVKPAFENDLKRAENIGKRVKAFGTNN